MFLGLTPPHPGSKGAGLPGFSWQLELGGPDPPTAASWQQHQQQLPSQQGLRLHQPSPPSGAALLLQSKEAGDQVQRPAAPGSERRLQYDPGGVTQASPAQDGRRVPHHFYQQQQAQQGGSPAYRGSTQDFKRGESLQRHSSQTWGDNSGRESEGESEGDHREAQQHQNQGQQQQQQQQHWGSDEEEADEGGDGVYRHASDEGSEDGWDEDTDKQAQQHQQRGWVPWQTDQKQDKDCTMPVDLRLAQTYVPAFTCLLRCSVLIILLSRPWACYSLPLHACLGAVIYVDRVARSEVILDSNAMMGTLLVAHTVNAFRSAPDQHVLHLSTRVPVEHHQHVSPYQAKQLAVAAILHDDRNSSALPNGLHLPGKGPLSVSDGFTHTPTLLGEAVQAAFVANSLLLVWGLDLSAAGTALLLVVVGSCSLLSARRRRGAAAQGRGRYAQRPLLVGGVGPSEGTGACRVCTVVLGCLLLVGYTQTPMDRPVGMAPVSIISRSFLFLCLCLVWSYTAGIHDMVQLLHASPRGPALVALTVPRGGKTRGTGCRVLVTVAQSFIPCQLRFTCVLFLHGSTLFLVSGCMGTMLLYLVLKIRHATAVAASSSHRLPQKCGSEKETPDGEEGQQQHQLPGPRYAPGEAGLLRSRKGAGALPALRDPRRPLRRNPGGGKGAVDVEDEELSTWSLDSMVHPDYRIPCTSWGPDGCSGEAVGRCVVGHEEIAGAFINAGCTGGVLAGSTPCENPLLLPCYCDSRAFLAWLGFSGGARAARKRCETFYYRAG